MFGFIFKRIVEAIPVLFVVVLITFVLMRIAPGGPFDSEKTVAPEIMERLNERYNLNAPMHEQFFDYLGNVVQGNLGPSFKYPGRTVNEMIADGFPITFELGVYAIIFAILVGTLAGGIAALRKNSWLDYLPMSAGMLGICVPSISLGPLLLLGLSIHLPNFFDAHAEQLAGFLPGFLLNFLENFAHFFPVSGWEGGFFENMEYKILPAITLGSGVAAYVARLTRGSMLEILNQDFIRTARAKGLKETTVVFKHALKGGLFPVISFLGPAMAGLLGGSFVTETIFQIPGLGRFYVQGAFNRDYTMIMGTTLLFAAMLFLFNMLVDIVLIALNPRLKFEGGK